MNGHNNSNKSDEHKGMMWMMVICCALPLIILFFIGSKVSIEGYFWPILIGVFIILHIWMMSKRHKKHEGYDENEKTNVLDQSETKDENKHNRCCH